MTRRVEENCAFRFISSDVSTQNICDIMRRRIITGVWCDFNWIITRIWYTASISVQQSKLIFTKVNAPHITLSIHTYQYLILQIRRRRSMLCIKKKVFCFPFLQKYWGISALHVYNLNVWWDASTSTPISWQCRPPFNQNDCTQICCLC